MTNDIDIYRGRKPIEVPAYSPAEAAGLLLQPKATIRSWVLGQAYRNRKGDKRLFRPVIKIADTANRLLSFENLVELHVLSALRRQHTVRLPMIRKALDYLKQTFHSEHPLAQLDLQSDGISVFVQRYGRLIDASQNGQAAMEGVIGQYLKRVERGADRQLARLYPFTRPGSPDGMRISIDPTLQFGRPCLAKTGIPTAEIADRFIAGESVELLVEDYSRPRDEIEEALRYETNIREKRAA